MSHQRARSPRSIDYSHPALRSVAVNERPPAKDSISWKLWLASHDLAQEALHTDYVEGIRKGDLDPNRYGQYTVQDAVYCHFAEGDYRTQESRARKSGEPELAAFAKARADGYAQYNQETFAAWHVKDVSALAPGRAVETYVDFEERITGSWDPVYGFIAMIPCEQLWPFLAGELRPAAGPGNLYSFWITGNASWGGAYRLDNFIDGWFAAQPGQLSWDDALYVYRSCMTCEVNFFRSAAGQTLLPMPSRNGS